MTPERAQIDSSPTARLLVVGLVVAFTKRSLTRAASTGNASMSKSG